MYYPYLLILKAHFEDNQFEQDRQDGRKLLKWNAGPTQFDEESTSNKRKALTKICHNLPVFQHQSNQLPGR